MTRRNLLTSTLALAGMASASPAVAPKVWMWLDRPVTGWKIEVACASGAHYGASGTDRAGFDLAQKFADDIYPLSKGNIHRTIFTCG